MGSTAVSKLSTKPYFLNKRYISIPIIGTATLGISFLPTMGFYTGFSQAKLETSQKQLLDAVQNDFQKKGFDVKFTVEKVKLPESGYKLNVIKCLRGSGGSESNISNSKISNSKLVNSEAKSKPFIVMHGYGAGGAMFANNLAGLAYSLNRPIYAVDWIGFGASSRPKFREKNVTASIDFFINPFEEWRKQMKIDQMDLMGHSFGGYLVGEYCANYGGEKYVD